MSTLLEQEANSKVPPVTEEKIKGFYDTNKDRVRIELAKVQDQIRDYLRERKVEARKNKFVAVLRSNAKVTTYLKPPTLYRAEVNFIGSAYTRRGEGAGDDRQVRGLSVSVLQERTADV